MREMSIRLWPGALAASMVVLLSACGGGGGSGAAEPAPPITPTTPTAPDPKVLAQNAGLSAEYSLRRRSMYSLTAAVDLQWTDAFSDETGYRIELQQADGSWTEAGRLPAQAGSGGKMSFGLWSWQAIRVLAELPGQAVTLRTVGQLETLKAVGAPASGLGLKPELLNQPLAGVVTLGLVEGGPASTSTSVELNGQTLSFGSADPGVAWDTRTVVDGRYAYGLKRQLDADRRFVEAGALRVAQRNPSAIVQFETRQELAGASIDILRWDDAAASEPRLLIDGVEVAKPLMQGCMGESSCLALGGRNLTGMYVRIADFASGVHQLTVRLDMKDGRRQEYSGSLSFDRPPVVALSVDPDGSAVTQELRVQGRLSDDGGTAELRILIDGELRGQVAQGDFDQRLDTSALSDGEHRLTLLARDAAGQETRLEKLVLKLAAGQRAQLMGAQMRLLDASAETLLAVDPRLPVPGLLWLRAGNPVERLALGTGDLISSIELWRATDDGLLGVAKEPYGYGKPWYRWDRSLKPAELSLESGRIFGRPLADGPWVAGALADTSSSDVRVSLLHQGTGQRFAFSRIADGPNANSGANLVEGGLVALTGSARLVWTSKDALMLSDTATNRSELLERGDNIALPVTDGSQVAWQRGSGDTAELMLRSASPGGDSKRVAPQPGQQLRNFALHSGLLVWMEVGAGKGWLYVLRDGKPQLLAENIGQLFGTAQQRIVYSGESGRLMLWTAARGARVIFPGGSAVLRGSALMVDLSSYLGLGSYLYRIPLDQLE